MHEEEVIQSGADSRSVEAGGSRGAGGGGDPEGWDQRAEVLPVEGKVSRDGSGSGTADEAAAGGKSALEAVGGGTDAGQGDVAGCALKIMVKPSRRGPKVERLMES